MFSVGDNIISTESDFIAVAKGARWVGKVECMVDLGGALLTLHTVGFWVTPGKKPTARPTRRAVASDTVTLLKR
jgi:hypothetical protein